MPQHRRNTSLFTLKPMRSPASTMLLRCYAREGHCWFQIPERNVLLLLLLVEPARALGAGRPDYGRTRGPWRCEAVQAPWRVLLWLLADDSLPLGEPDEIDPAVAWVEFCRSPEMHSPARDT